MTKEEHNITGDANGNVFEFEYENNTIEFEVSYKPKITKDSGDRINPPDESVDVSDLEITSAKLITENTTAELRLSKKLKDYFTRELIYYIESNFSIRKFESDYYTPEYSKELFL